MKEAFVVLTSCKKNPAESIFPSETNAVLEEVKNYPYVTREVIEKINEWQHDADSVFKHATEQYEQKTATSPFLAIPEELYPHINQSLPFKDSLDQVSLSRTCKKMHQIYNNEIYKDGTLSFIIKLTKYGIGLVSSIRPAKDVYETDENRLPKYWSDNFLKKTYQLKGYDPLTLQGLRSQKFSDKDVDDIKTKEREYAESLTKELVEKEDYVYCLPYRKDDVETMQNKLEQFDALCSYVVRGSLNVAALSAEDINELAPLLADPTIQQCLDTEKLVMADLIDIAKRDHQEPSLHRRQEKAIGSRLRDILKEVEVQASLKANKITERQLIRILKEETKDTPCRNLARTFIRHINSEVVQKYRASGLLTIEQLITAMEKHENRIGAWSEPFHFGITLNNQEVQRYIDDVSMTEQEKEKNLPLKDIKKMRVEKAINLAFFEECHSSYKEIKMILHHPTIIGFRNENKITMAQVAELTDRGLALLIGNATIQTIFATLLYKKR